MPKRQVGPRVGRLVGAQWLSTQTLMGSPRGALLGRQAQEGPTLGVRPKRGPLWAPGPRGPTRGPPLGLYKEGQGGAPQPRVPPLEPPPPPGRRPYLLPPPFAVVPSRSSNRGATLDPRTCGYLGGAALGALDDHNDKVLSASL